ncbi:ribbon-helix-helix protein, CopG family [Candidatus Woesearchaeota archaeon]|nr:ribbon-helix-helix protein, CopG family [Candidatus Woesearchaeota archaeon]
MKADYRLSKISRTATIRLPNELLEAVEDLCHEQGVERTALLREWVAERLELELNSKTPVVR